MKVTPKDFFLWLGAMGALYFSVGSFIVLLFEYIDRVFGSAVVGYDPYSAPIRFAIATLLVLFPLFIFLTRMLNNELRARPEKKELWVRRWLIFLTVFAAGIGLIIDLIVLINTFLGGEVLTASFMLKVATVFVVFGTVFYYYLNDIRGVWEHNEARSKIIGATVSAVVLISIVGGFFIIGSPATQRELRNDQTRINDLRNIQLQIINYYRSTSELPESLTELKDPLIGSSIPRDPATDAPYEYKTNSPLTFELCAVFAHPLPKRESRGIKPTNFPTPERIHTFEDWDHEAGRACFERTIDSERITPTRR